MTLSSDIGFMHLTQGTHFGVCPTERLGSPLLRRRKLLVFQQGSEEQFEQGITKQVRILPIVKRENHFVQVGRKMLCRNPMPGTDDAALEQRECPIPLVVMRRQRRCHPCRGSSWVPRGYDLSGPTRDYVPRLLLQNLSRGCGKIQSNDL